MLNLYRTSLALVEHAWSHHHGHSVDWDKVRVLEQLPHLYHRLTLESIHIRSHPHTLNRNDGTLSQFITPCLFVRPTSVPCILPDPIIPAPLSLFITYYLTCCHSCLHLAPFVIPPCFVLPLMQTTAWLSKRLAIINQFWLVEFGVFYMHVACMHYECPAQHTCNL